MPVDCTVSGRPSGVCPLYPQRPRLWLLISGFSISSWASAIARPGSPGSRASGASGWEGSTWGGTATGR